MGLTIIEYIPMTNFQSRFLNKSANYGKETFNLDVLISDTAVTSSLKVALTVNNVIKILYNVCE